MGLLSPSLFHDAHTVEPMILFQFAVSVRTRQNQVLVDCIQVLL